MKAAIWHQAKDIRVEEVSLKPHKETEVVVRVAWAGICGSDLHEYLEGPIFIPVDHKDSLTGGQAPLALGHEFSGVVQAIGNKVTKFQVGDHVSINPTLTYGKSSDNIDIYDGYNFIGLGCDGGLAELVNVPEANLYHLPNDFSLKLAATIEPTAVAVQAIKEGALRFGQTVAIFGAGPIGVLIAAAAKAAGATKIIAVDLSITRLKKALELGATDIINPAESDPLEQINQLVPGGVDVSFEVAGVQPTFEQAISATRPRGKMVIVAIYGHPIQFNPMQLTNTGVQLTTTIAYSREAFKQTVALVSQKQINTAPVITKEISLTNIVDEGFKALTTDKSQAKILIKLSGE
ncbi:2,3-butanediol dehydrogenase [Lentilactobacillus hilgardii]|uniref:2,3-butanediol dehydrogenase n=1 Tax=Lentilactobacillus hilgardii TaxID=1588 RepID=UPI0021A49C1C|nr:2,3-butanediol dehydrogenase [Lentilactobacillus hilgardii]MCT3397566.1 2,3-butanediol dehydrogenase [Lentilactobacillus hilgardii]